MTAWTDDESFERELFAVRARALPAFRLDLGGVVARAATPARRAKRPGAAWLAWLGSAACAAAVLAVPQPASRVHPTDVAWDGLTCPASACVATPASRDEAMCAMTPSELVCERDVTSSSSEP